MEGSIAIPIILQIILILFNAIFACAELAVISMNDNRLARMAQEGDPRALRLKALTDQPARFLATIQVAITLSGFLGAAFAADNFAEYLVTFLQNVGVGIAPTTLRTLSVILITLVLSYLTLVFGELVPKRIGMHHAESIALGLSGLISFLQKLFAPIVWLLTLSTNVVLRLFRIDPHKEEESITEEEIRMLIDQGTEKGTIDADEKEMLQKVFEFDDLVAGDICTHRTDVVILWTQDSIDDWDKTIHGNRYNNYPLCDESADDVKGIINAKDYFRTDNKTKEEIMKHAFRPAVFVPESVRADILFSNMRQNRAHFAIVLDEYGGMEGIITMNDLLEQLVGDIDDEHDPMIDLAAIVPVGEEKWQIHGSTLVEDVQELLDLPLSDESETMGGYIFSALGSIPDDGTTFTIDSEGLHIEVLEIRDHKIEKAFISFAPLPENFVEGEE